MHTKSQTAHHNQNGKGKNPGAYSFHDNLPCYDAVLQGSYRTPDAGFAPHIESQEREQNEEKIRVPVGAFF